MDIWYSLILGSTRILAIDPGLSGAVCAIGQGSFEVSRDFKSLAEIAYAIKLHSPGCSHAVMENVHAMPGQGVCSMFSFGRAAGAADGALALCCPRVIYVVPQVWQKWARQMAEWPKEVKFDSVQCAKTLLPASEGILTRKKDHNSADALLIGLWGLAKELEGANTPPKA